MSLKVWLKLLSFVTVIALIYTHMQMQIFELAYKGSRRQKQMHELRDRHGMLTHQILTLKSSNNLGNRLLEKDSNLEFIGNNNVLTLKGPQVTRKQSSAKPLVTKNENVMWNFLSFLSPQEAKAWERR